MANFVNPVSFYDPSIMAEQAMLQRQQALAESLMSQGASPIDPTRRAGRFVVPISPWEGVGKMGQSLAGALMQRQIFKNQADLQQRQMAGLTTMFGGAGATAAPSPSEGTVGNVLGAGAAQGDIGPTNTNAQRLALATELRNQSPQTSQSPFIPGIAGLTPQQNAMLLMLNPNAFVSGAISSRAPTEFQKVVAAARAGDPDAIAWVRKNTNMPIEQVRQNSVGVDPVTKKPVLVNPAAPAGTMNVYEPGSPYPTNTPVPGAAPNSAAYQGQVQAAISNAKQPFVTGTTEIPIYLPGGDQTTVKLNPVQMAEYNRTGRLPPEIAATVPGLQPSPINPGTPINNPGNLRPSGASTGFQQFTTPQEGISAIDRNLQSYGARGLNTISKIINTWAPSSENNTSAYVADVSKRLGVTPDQALDMNNPVVRHTIASAIILHEQGSSLFSSPQHKPLVGRTQTQTEQITQKRQEAGGKAVDEQFAKDYLAFMNGGAQDAQRQLAQLQDVSTRLGAKGTNLTGPFIGATPNSVLNFVNPAAVATKERVEEVVQRTLRAILGAQFTEGEGTRLIARAYNPNMSEAENKIRVDRLLTQLRNAFVNKQSAANYYSKAGTLQGWNGKLPSISDFDPEEPKGGTITSSTPSVEALVKKYGKP